LFTNEQEGYLVNNASDVVFLGGKIRDNNPADKYSSGWEAGGGKVQGSSTVVFDTVESFGNHGPGIWYDIDNSGAIVQNCRIHNNLNAGIFFEISDGASIHDNIVWDNGSASSGWNWAAGILISSSKNASVYANIVRSRFTGVAVLSQDRGQARWNAVTGNLVHDNDIIMAVKEPTGSSEYAGVGFAQDFAGTLETGNNFASANRFWFPPNQPTWNRFSWWQGKSLETLAALNASTLSTLPSRYLTDAEKDAILASAGILA
jgi:hypothetical protein